MALYLDSGFINQSWIQQIADKNNISFKGYDVRPLKGLYVQGFCKPDELKIFSELKSIAKQEKFNLVFNQNNTKLLQQQK